MMVFFCIRPTSIAAAVEKVSEGVGGGGVSEGGGGGGLVKG